MKKSTVFFLAAVSMLAGIIIGFLCAPIKGGVSVGNNCGNRYFDNDDDIEDLYGC